MKYELSMTWALPECIDTHGAGGIWDTITSDVTGARHSESTSRIMLCYAIAISIAIHSCGSFLVTQKPNSSNVPQMAPTVWRRHPWVCLPFYVETLHGFSWRFREHETSDIGQTSEGLRSPA